MDTPTQHLYTLYHQQHAVSSGPNPTPAVASAVTPLARWGMSRFSNSRATPEVTQDEEPVVAVIGVGYVGTHLVEAFAGKYTVIGFEVSEARAAQLRVDTKFRDKSNVSFTTNPYDLEVATHFLISVPTLLREDKTVDTSYLESALSTVKARGRRGATIVIESSVAVGMTRCLLLPICESHGFHGGMSPEVSHRNPQHNRVPAHILIHPSVLTQAVQLPSPQSPS